MKYIKPIFESLYKQINKEELLDRRRYGWDDFKPYELSWLRNFFNSSKSVKHRIVISNDFIEFYFGYSRSSSEIQKMSDEYFTVVLHDYDGLKFYECDEFEGLKQLLTEKIH